MNSIPIYDHMTGGCAISERRAHIQPASFDTVKLFTIVESPYMGATQELLARNKAYARAAIRDSILKGEAPFASHLLYTQPGVLRDEVHEERELGMGLGWHIMKHADRVVFYTDLGWSSGMLRGKVAANDARKQILERTLGPSFGGWEENYHPSMENF